MKGIVYGLAFVLPAMAALGACAPKETATQLPDMIPVPDGVVGLAGTSWQLVEFRSMDDAQGIKRPGDVTRYTVSFDAEGRASFRLDCNRGTGSYTREVSSATGGTLTFGPIAVTKALCPEPSMGEFLEKQLPWVRSYTMADGHLNMALMADGGIIVWEALPSAP
ncbi:MAG: META domain-containing protein [Novosphingobium sp.]|nr:META domain-containing protein [Novosphingobium sp.]